MKKYHISNSPKKVSSFLKITPKTLPKKPIKTSLINSELLKFISKGIKNKLNLNPTFDHKGAKNFLESKKLALQEISVNDDIINNEYEIIDFSSEKIIIRGSVFPSKNCLTPEKIYKCQNENTKSSKNKIKKKESKNKNKIRKPLTDKFLWNYNIGDDDDESNKNKEKEKKIRKKSHKIHELKMLKDKDIKEIEPIENQKDKNNKYNFVYTEETDLSLFDMVSKI